MAVEDAQVVPKPADVTARAPGETYFEVLVKPTGQTLRLWPHTWSLFFGGFAPTAEAAPLGLQLFLIQQVLLGWVGASVAILVGVIITAFFIPNMLRKGTIDLLLVKPVHRSTLLVYKFIGGLIFMALNTAAAVIGVWLVLGLRSGIWGTSIFWMIPVLTFSFAILYAISTFFAVLTRSAIVAILMTCLAWGILWAVSTAYAIVEGQRVRQERNQVAEEERIDAHWFAKTVYVLHYALPRRGDLDALTTQLLIRDLLTNNQVKAEKLDRTRVSWGESVTVSCLYVVALLGLSCWWFATRDY